MEAWNDTFTGISAEWTVPAVQPTTALTDSSTWVGLDGDPAFDGTTAPDLVQVGTDSPSENGSVLGYLAWYEMSPGAETPLFLVSPGDTMQAVMTETAPGSGKWSLAIGDLTVGVAWTDANLSYSSPGLTGEWVEEATTLGGAISPLQDFGSVTMSDLQYVATTTTPYYQDDYMVDGSGNVIAYPTVSGQSLTMTYGAPATTGPGGLPPTAGEGSISGSVTEAGSTAGLSGTCVWALNQSTPATYEVMTGAAGAYDFDDVVLGTYNVIADPTCGGTVASTYAQQFDAGETVTVSQPQLTLNIGLPLGSTISGTVTDGPSGTTPLIGACVDTYYLSGGVYYLFATASTTTGGVYTVGSLPVGTYVLEFDPTCASSTDAIGFSGGGTSFSTAGTITVSSAGSTLSGQNAVLATGAEISGVVTAPAFQGDDSGICVYVYGPDDQTALVYGLTGTDGSYAVGNLPAGSGFRAQFDPTCAGAQLSDFSSQWYAYNPLTLTAGGLASLYSAPLVETALSPQVATTILPSGESGSAYFQVLTTTAGTGSIQWSWASSCLSAQTDLLDGLWLSAGGVIAGTPTSDEDCTVQLVAYDSSVPALGTEIGATLDIGSSASSGGSSLGGGGGFAPAPPKKTATTIKLVASPDPVSTGQQVTYTATVSPAPDGGTLVFTEDSQVITNCGLVSIFAASGQATCTTTYASPGERYVVATYSGDANFIGTVSAVFDEMVQGAAPTTTTTVAPHPVVAALTAKAAITKSTVKLGLRCSGAACSGEILLWHKNVLFGQARYSLAAGKSAPFAVRLSTKAMRMCTGGHSVVVNETVDLAHGVPVKATVKLVA